MTLKLHNWYALRVRSRHEFVTSIELTRKGVETFLPCIKKLSQWKDRKKLLTVPLFPGYLFVCIPSKPEAFLDVVKTRGAVSLISLEPGYPTPVPAEDICSVRKMTGSDQVINVYPFIQDGARVRIKRGPLLGAEGILMKKGNQHLFYVNIQILGRSICTKIYADDIEQA